jgi:hypothetical protein
MTNFPCAVERDLARYQAEIDERDRFEMALEEATQELLRSPEYDYCDPWAFADLFVAARDAAHPGISRAMDALRRGDGASLLHHLTVALYATARDAAREAARAQLMRERIEQAQAHAEDLAADRWRDGLRAMAWWEGR